MEKITIDDYKDFPDFEETVKLGEKFNSIIPKGIRKSIREKIKDPKLKAIAENEMLSNFLTGFILKSSVISLFTPKLKKRKRRRA